MSSLQECIQAAQTSHSLNLRKMGLTSLPDEILVLADTLQELLLTDNPLRVIPGWIGQFKKLKLLDVGNCKLKTLPTAILDLRGHLEEITYRGNEGFSPSLDNLCAKVYWGTAVGRIGIVGRRRMDWIVGMGIVAAAWGIADRAIWKRDTNELLQAFYRVTKDSDAIFKSAFKAALSRGSVESHSLKVLFLGAVMAGKTALLAALQGHTLPKTEDRSVATRMQRVRLVFNSEGFFEAVPLEEYRLASMIATSRDTTAADTGTDEGEVRTEASLSPSVAVLPSAATTPASSSTVIPDAAASSSAAIPAPPATTSTPTPLTMSAVQDLLMGELSEQHVDLDTFDFAGEPMFDSLPALFMGSESAYILVFDLSVMDDPEQAQRQYEHLSKWAHLIAHQVPESLSSYFRVLIVGTHVDMFPEDTVPPLLLRTVAREVNSLVLRVLGKHLIIPASGRAPFFQVGSKKRIGLAALSEGMHAAVRAQTLPLEYVCARDLVGRWARMGRIQLLSSVTELSTVQLSETTPIITVGALVPDEVALRTGLVPYMEEAADVLVCREDSSERRVCATDTIVFDVPRLIAAVELLCSVVMARWGRATGERAQDMLDLVTIAGQRLDPEKTGELLAQLDEARTHSEEGFPIEVAQWLLWTAAAGEASGEPLLAGADVTNANVLFTALERLSLVFRCGTRLLVPMLLPEDAPFVESARAPIQVLLYQTVKGTDGSLKLLPVSLATFHLVVVALWRESVKDSAIRASQRCTNVLVMEGCAPVRVRLNTNEPFVRVEVFEDGGPPERVMVTLKRVSERVCGQTRSLRWGWRGEPVLVPVNPFNVALPLFSPLKVAANPDHYHEAATVSNEILVHPDETRVCNETLEEWWTKRVGTGTGQQYSHAAALIVGVSRFSSTKKSHLAMFSDLPGVRDSVVELEALWQGRGFSVQSVTDKTPSDQVTKEEITKAAQRLVRDVGDKAGRDSLLIVHLLGHGVGDRDGGLVLSDAHRPKFASGQFGRHSRFDADSLKGLLRGDAGWLGCNILVVCDFCNSGTLLKDDADLTMSSPVARLGYSRQTILSSLPDTPSYMSLDGRRTRLTELLVSALGPSLEAFRVGEEHITAVGLRQRLCSLDKKNTFQAMLVGRIWDEWSGTRNDGDIFLFKTGSGVA